MVSLASIWGNESSAQRSLALAVRKTHLWLTRKIEKENTERDARKGEKVKPESKKEGKQSDKDKQKHKEKGDKVKL